MATVIAPVSSSMAKALPVLPPVMDHEMESSSPVLARSTTAVEAVAVSETVPVSSLVTTGATSVTVMVIVSSSVLPVVSSTWTVRV